MTVGAAQQIDFAVHPSTEPLPAAERERLLEAPGFGQVFTDNMVTIRWSTELGWHDAKLEPFGPLTLSPATSVFHYGQEIFEGLKAYRQAGGPIVAFRPQENAARFNRSAERMAMPELPEAAFVRAIELLVSQDRDWVPTREGHSLYLRPMMIATSPSLGISPRLHQGGSGRDRCRQDRRELRRGVRWAASGSGAWLRSGGLARRG